MFKKVLLLVTAIPWANGSLADAHLSNRMFHRMGITAGLVSDPFPSIWGIGAAYHWNDFLRNSLSYGTASVGDFHSSTFSLQATLLLPGRSLSPFLGLGYARSHFSTHLPSGFIEEIEGSGKYLYSSVGLEWQSAAGLNLALGYRFFLPWNGGLPGAQVAWYF